MAEVSQRMSFFSVGGAPKQIGATAPRNDEELGQRAKKETDLEERGAPKVGIATELRIRLLGWAKRMAEQIQKDDRSHQQVLAAIFGQTRLDKFPCVTSEGKPTIYATPWAKQFREDIKSLKEIDEDDDLVRELHEDFRKFFSCMSKISAHLTKT